MSHAENDYKNVFRQLLFSTQTRIIFFRNVNQMSVLSSVSFCVHSVSFDFICHTVKQLRSYCNSNISLNLERPSNLLQ